MSGTLLHNYNYKIFLKSHEEYREDTIKAVILFQYLHDFCKVFKIIHKIYSNHLLSNIDLAILMM